MAGSTVSTAFLLRKATQRVTGMAETALGPHGLTLRHFGILSTVAAEPGINQRLVGERLLIDRTTVVSLTDDLEDAGLVERRRGADRRSFSLYLTDGGQGRLTALMASVAEVHAEFLAPLSPKDRTKLRDLLHLLVKT